MLRPAFLYLSRQRTIRRWMETPAARPMTRRFIAGETLDEGVAVTAQLNQEGFLVALDHLGENVTTAAEADAARDAVLAALEAIQQRKLRATVAVKLTQFGLDIDPGLCRSHMRQLVAKAQSIGTRVEVDMEDSSYTQVTLDIVRELQAAFPGHVRAVIQAYLHRTEQDLRDLNGAGIPVRLCKGAYREPPEAAVQAKPEVDDRYVRFAKLQLADGTDPALATHDDRMIATALAHPKDQFEYQMLYGVRRDRQRELVAQGYRMRLYVPYGAAWYPYFMRRLAERPANVWFVLRSLLGK